MLESLGVNMCCLLQLEYDPPMKKLRNLYFNDSNIFSSVLAVDNDSNIFSSVLAVDQQGLLNITAKLGPSVLDIELSEEEWIRYCMPRYNSRVYLIKVLTNQSFLSGI